MVYFCGSQSRGRLCQGFNTRRFSTTTTAMDVDYLLSKWSVTRNGTVHILEEEMVDSFALANSPLAVVCIVLSYLLFSTKIGPKLMESQKPYDVKWLMMAYNLIQVAYNSWLVYLFLAQGGFSYFYEHVCYPPAINIRRVELVAGSYYYFVAKLLDLSDTVFMVLRKKSHQLSVLQLFHHSTMVFSVWISLKFIRDQAGLVLGVLNSFIHIIMYSYYYLACFGPSVQKYLWWKKYLTIIQMCQFVFGMVMIVTLVCLGCEIHLYYSYLWLGNLTAFIFLFYNYYKRSYTKKSGQKTE